MRGLFLLLCFLISAYNVDCKNREDIHDEINSAVKANIIAVQNNIEKMRADLERIQSQAHKVYNPNVKNTKESSVSVSVSSSSIDGNDPNITVEISSSDPNVKPNIEISTKENPDYFMKKGSNHTKKRKIPT